MSMEYVSDIKDLMKGIYMIDKKADLAVKMFAETNAKVMESDAKIQAKWTDRTGDARKRLRGYVEEMPTGYRIVLAHGVDYGLWLELAHEKRFAIVEPIVRLTSPYIMQEFQGLLDKMGY